MTARRDRAGCRARGFSIIEAIVAMAILTVGVMGIAGLQVLGHRGRNYATNMATASLLAHDLADNMERWAYNDPRLNTLSLVTSTTSSVVTGLWDMGTAQTVPSSLRAEFSETVGDANALTSNALGATYMGLKSPAGFTRYWNVFGVDLAGIGQPQSKLVQIIVRWNEPGLGMHQVAISTCIVDPGALLQ